jgi:hypothetical protein
MPSSRPAPNARRQMFLKVSGQIEGQLRDAYAKKHEAGVLNQSSLADKLDVDRSAIHRRLTGRTNMTEETIADMVWALEYDIDIRIYDPAETRISRLADNPPTAVAPLPPKSLVTNATDAEQVASSAIVAKPFLVTAS